MRVLPTPEQRQAPYDFYAEMRRDHPVAHDDERDLWAVFRYDDVRAVVADWERFSSELHRFPRRGFLRRRRLRESLLSSDPPRHTKLRNLVSKAFTPKAIADLEARIRTIAQDLFTRAAASGRMDLVDDFSYPLPVTVIAELLGVPAQEHDRYKRWADGLLGTDDDLFAADDAHAEDLPERTREEMDEYFRHALAQRRRQPQDDLMSALVRAEIDGERLSEDELLSFCELLLLAGHVTTTNLVANAIAAFVDHPGTWERLRAEPRLLPLAIEETLRYDSPVQALIRVSVGETELGGQRIAAGQPVLAWIAAADRDETRFADAERFDVAREPNPHLAFGAGVHF